MWEELLVKESIRRREILRNLSKYLRIIAETVKRLDPNAEAYLFGSVAEGKSLVSSDIDVLVVTSLKPETVISELWRKGIEDPFEIHVVSPEQLQLYKSRAKLMKIT